MVYISGRACSVFFYTLNEKEQKEAGDEYPIIEMYLKKDPPIVNWSIKERLMNG